MDVICARRMIEQKVVKIPRRNIPHRPTLFRVLIWRRRTIGIGRIKMMMSKKIEMALSASTEVTLGMQVPGTIGFHDFSTFKNL
jgi:demethoxyubiquinone hydroxylase (CLK1/Coq7/Cat5 family)